MNDDGSGTAEAGTESSTSFGPQFYRALASRERRRLLTLLLDGEERRVEEVATLLVGWDGTATGTAKGPRDRERVHLRLVHAHLPMLDEAGLVNYNPNCGTVRAGSLTPEMIEHLERSIDDWNGGSD